MSKKVKKFIKGPQADFGATFVMYSSAFLYFNPKTFNYTNNILSPQGCPQKPSDWLVAVIVGPKAFG